MYALLWSASANKNGNVCTVSDNGNKNNNNPNKRKDAVRPDLLLKRNIKTAIGKVRRFLKNKPVIRILSEIRPCLKQRKFSLF